MLHCTSFGFRLIGLVAVLVFTLGTSTMIRLPVYGRDLSCTSILFGLLWGNALWSSDDDDRYIWA